MGWQWNKHSLEISALPRHHQGSSQAGEVWYDLLPRFANASEWPEQYYKIKIVSKDLWFFWASQVALLVNSPPASEGDVRDSVSIPGLGRSPRGGHDNLLQYSCGRIPWTDKPGRLWSIGSQRVRYDWGNLAWMLFHFTSHCFFTTTTDRNKKQCCRYFLQVSRATLVMIQHSLPS